MHAAALRLELRVPNVRSLKEKRRRLKSLMSQLTTTFPAAVSEVGFQDHWQRATLGVALVAPQAGQLERLIHSVRRLVDQQVETELLAVGIAYLEER